MALKNRSDLKALVDTKVPTNLNNTISATDVRAVLKEIIDSSSNILDDGPATIKFKTVLEAEVYSDDSVCIWTFTHNRNKQFFPATLVDGNLRQVNGAIIQYGTTTVMQILFTQRPDNITSYRLIYI